MKKLFIISIFCIIFMSCKTYNNIQITNLHNYVKSLDTNKRLGCEDKYFLLKTETELLFIKKK